jgi:hypothetical protein
MPGYYNPTYSDKALFDDTGSNGTTGNGLGQLNTYDPSGLFSDGNGNLYYSRKDAEHAKDFFDVDDPEMSSSMPSMTKEQYYAGKLKLDQDFQRDRNIQMWGGFGMGGAQLGLGLMSYLDSSKTNAMNRNLIQQQIDTNNQLMADRGQRNADISRAFGPNGVMSKATGL